jgi:ABC-2 type transport system permease protein
MQRNIQAILMIWERELLRYWRDRIRIVTSLMQPLLFLFIFGSGLSASLQFGSPNGVNTSFQTFLFPGVLGMTVLFTAIFSAISIVWDREFGFLREILVAPISRSSIVLGKALGGSTVSMIQGTIMLIFAPLIGIQLTPVLVLQLMGLMLLLAFTLTSLGIVVAARMKSMEGFQMIMQFFLMPMFFLSGALFPLHGLPVWLSVLTQIDPVSYGVDPLRRVVFGPLHLPALLLQRFGVGLQVLGYSLSLASELLILGGIGIVFITIAAWAFSRQE